MNLKIFDNPLIKALISKARNLLPPGSVMSLYGSRARGTATPESDWDIHILVPGGERLSLNEEDEYCFPLSDLGLSVFDEIVNPRAYTFKGWDKRSFLPFHKNVEQDKIILLKT